MKTRTRGRKSSSGACYNRRHISRLENGAGCSKMEHSFHRHSQGKKVKSFVPEGEWPQNGEPGQWTAGQKRASNRLDGLGVGGREVTVSAAGSEQKYGA